MFKIVSVVGARPNFMKVAPLHRAFLESGQIDSKIVHTGQHYDPEMSAIFFQQLGMPQPHYYLGIGGGSHTYQTATVMLKFEEVIEKEKPDLVLVVGDVNASLAATLVAVKKGIDVAHVEAGLRSGDRTMPEEINRILTDSVCQYHFVSEHSGLVHLARENTQSQGIHLVGNTMIDSLFFYRERAKKENILENLALDARSYILFTMHRPKNVDSKAALEAMVELLDMATKRLAVVFPLHPRTANNLEKFGLKEKLTSLENLYCLPPQGYLQFLYLMDNARMVLTDSGGIQEETTFLQIPCLTFRDSTERPITITLGTNKLIADLQPNSVVKAIDNILSGKELEGIIPPLWDGKTAQRITAILLEEYHKGRLKSHQLSS